MVALPSLYRELSPHSTTPANGAESLRFGTGAGVAAPIDGDRPPPSEAGSEICECPIAAPDCRAAPGRASG